MKEKSQIEKESFEKLEKIINKISHDAYYKESPKQLIIDIIEEIEEAIADFTINNDRSNSVYGEDYVGSFLYKLHITLEIINPKLTTEITYLKSLYSGLDEWYENLRKNFN